MLCFHIVSVMSSYNATVALFSNLCLSQLKQPLSALDAANDGFGATLVPRTIRAHLRSMV